MLLARHKTITAFALLCALSQSAFAVDPLYTTPTVGNAGPLTAIQSPRAGVAMPLPQTPQLGRNNVTVTPQQPSLLAEAVAANNPPASAAVTTSTTTTTTAPATTTPAAVTTTTAPTTTVTTTETMPAAPVQASTTQTSTTVQTTASTAAPIPPPPPGSLPRLVGVPNANSDSFQSWIKNNQQNAAAMNNDNNLPSRYAGCKPSPKKRVARLRTLKGPDAPLVQSPPLTYEQSRQIMLNSAPESEPPSPESVAAFHAMTKQNVPLNPQQIVQLRQVIDASQRAATIPATVPPKPVSSTIMINLAPGATPPAIRLAQGYISTLVFVDSTGQPWPIAAYDIGDPKATNIQWDGKSNILLIQGVTPYSDSNLIVRLIGLPTPVALEIVSGQRVVDFRTDIHVSGIGPNSKDLPLGTPLPDSANQLLLSVLDGVAPPGSRQLSVKGGDCQAWLMGSKMYLRTRLTVLSPGWVGKMSSPDGMMAYEIQSTSSVLVSQYGNPIELKIEGL